MPLSYDEFLTRQNLDKPYALMDLDDTLFQTKRKLSKVADDTLVVASVNKQGNPLSFLTPTQAQFFAWLSTHTTLIPVTARDTQEIGRVLLPFDDVKILTHGAVILDKHGQKDPLWSSVIARELVSYQHKLALLIDKLTCLDDKLIITPHSDEFCGDEFVIYIAIKHQDKDHDRLLTWADTIPTLYDALGIGADDFYIHVNANNLAILPHAIHKKHAVRHLKEHYLTKQVATFGFGDSLADLPFLIELDWYGTPNKGQLHHHILKSLS